jgi:hypothetical protein
MDDGHIVVDSITPIALADITDDLARESGFSTVKDVLQIARHGSGDNIYLIRFHYLPAGGWDVPVAGQTNSVSANAKKSGAKASRRTKE